MGGAHLSGADMQYLEKLYTTYPKDYERVGDEVRGRIRSEIAETGEPAPIKTPSGREIRGMAVQPLRYHGRTPLFPREDRDWAECLSLH